SKERKDRNVLFLSGLDRLSKVEIRSGRPVETFQRIDAVRYEKDLIAAHLFAVKLLHHVYQREVRTRRSAGKSRDYPQAAAGLIEIVGEILKDFDEVAVEIDDHHLRSVGKTGDEFLQRLEFAVNLRKIFLNHHRKIERSILADGRHDRQNVLFHSVLVNDEIVFIKRRNH